MALLSLASVGRWYVPPASGFRRRCRLEPVGVREPEKNGAEHGLSGGGPLREGRLGPGILTLSFPRSLAACACWVSARELKEDEGLSRSWPRRATGGERRAVFSQ